MEFISNCQGERWETVGRSRCVLSSVGGGPGLGGPSLLCPVPSAHTKLGTKMGSAHCKQGDSTPLHCLLLN